MISNSSISYNALLHSSNEPNLIAVFSMNDLLDKYRECSVLSEVSDSIIVRFMVQLYSDYNYMNGVLLLIFVT